MEAQEIQRNPYLGTGTDRIVKCRTKTKVLKQKPEDSGIITVLNKNKGQFKTVCFVKQSNIRAKERYFQISKNKSVPVYLRPTPLQETLNDLLLILEGKFEM